MGAIALFGWLLEKRHGWWAPLLVYLVCGVGGAYVAAEVFDESIVRGANGAALGMLAAWTMRDVLGRRHGREDDSDLLGVLAIAAVLVLLPLATTEASGIAGIVGGVAGILLGSVRADARALRTASTVGDASHAFGARLRERRRHVCHAEDGLATRASVTLTLAACPGGALPLAATRDATGHRWLTESAFARHARDRAELATRPATRSPPGRVPPPGPAQHSPTPSPPARTARTAPERTGRGRR